MIRQPQVYKIQNPEKYSDIKNNQLKIMNMGGHQNTPYKTLFCDDFGKEMISFEGNIEKIVHWGINLKFSISKMAFFTFFPLYPKRIMTL